MKENDYVIWGVNIGIVKNHPEWGLYVHTTEDLNLAIDLGWKVTTNENIINEIKASFN